MGDYLNVPKHMSPLKAESFLWREAEEEVREIWKMRIHHIIASFEDWFVKECRWLLEADSSLWLTASKSSGL